jgi:hypothetical protein
MKLTLWIEPHMGSVPIWKDFHTCKKCLELILQEMRRPWKVVFGFGVSFGTALGSEPRVPHMPGKLLPWKVFFCLFVFVGLRLELRASHLQSTLPLKPHLQSNCSGYFEDRFCKLFSQLASIRLSISASQIARVTGASHQCPASYWILGTRIEN